MPSFDEFADETVRTPRERSRSVGTTISRHFSKTDAALDLMAVWNSSAGDPVFDRIAELWDRDLWEARLIVNRREKSTWAVNDYIVEVTRDTTVPSDRAQDLLEEHVPDFVREPPYKDGPLAKIRARRGFLRYYYNVPNTPVFYFGTTQLLGRASYQYRLPEAIGIIYGVKGASNQLDALPLINNSPEFTERLVLKLLARTNPVRSRSEPVLAFIEAAVDSPRFDFIAKQRGLLKSLANGTLFWNFAVLPIFFEIQRLLKLPVTLSQVEKDLKRLLDDRPVRKRANLDLQTSEGYVDRYFRDYWQGHSVTVSSWKYETEHEYWGTVRWRSTAETRKVIRRFLSVSRRGRDYPGLKQLSEKIAFGLTRGQIPYSVWEAIPFSWLVDYFFAVGDLLRATNNEFHLEFDSINLMRSSTYKTWVSRVRTIYPAVRTTVFADVTEEVYQAPSVTKYKARIQPGPVDELRAYRQPILTERQLGIIASLGPGLFEPFSAIDRLMRRFRVGRPKKRPPNQLIGPNWIMQLEDVKIL